MNSKFAKLSAVGEDSLLFKLVRENRIPHALQEGDVVTKEELCRSFDLLRSRPFTTDAAFRYFDETVVSRQDRRVRRL